MTTLQAVLIAFAVLVMVLPFTGALGRPAISLFRLAVNGAFALAAGAGLLIAVIQMAIIVTRNVFEVSFIWFEEIPFYLFGVMFLLSGGAILLMDAHVRVDVLYSKWTEKRQRLVDLLGLYLFTAPFGALIMIAALPFVARAAGDGALNPGGIPGVLYLKALIPLFGLTIVLASAVRASDLLSGTAAHADHEAGV